MELNWMIFFSFHYKRVSRLGGQKQSAVLSQPVAVVCSICWEEGARPFSFPANRGVLTYHLYREGKAERRLALFSLFILEE